MCDNLLNPHKPQEEGSLGLALPALQVLHLFMTTSLVA